MWKLARIVAFASLGSAVLLADAETVAGLDAQFRFATFVGTVTDSNGNRVAGADVLITHTGNRLKRAATTGADGTYSMANVQPGTYDIRISLGSSTMFERRGIIVRGGDIARVNTQLKTTVNAAAAPPIVDTRQVQVSLHTYGADGRPEGVAAIGGAVEFTSYLWADVGLCGLKSGGEPGPAPAVGWRISGRAVDRTSDAMTVRIEWQRLWDNGVRQPKPQSGTLEATIRRGERFPLDSVTSAATADCAITGGSLEATVIARPAATGRGGRAPAPSARSTAGARSSADQAQDQLSEAAQLLLLRDRSAEQYQELARLVPGAFQVELWLVQTKPDNTELVQLITQPLGGSTSFVFPPVRISSDNNAAEVEVFGFLRRTQGEDGANRLSLQVAIGRNLRQPGPRPVESYSASGKVVPWPAPAEVLSFELPVSTSDQRVLAGHRFDLRVRITPR